MFKDFPSLHPLTTHFPIVLILLAVVFQAVIVWKPDWVQIRWATLFLMAGGFLSAWAVSTLFHAMISPEAPKSALMAFSEHEKYAQFTLWMAGITFLLKGIGDVYKINRRSYDLVVLAAAMLAAALVSVTGHHGARLTHIEGVGPMGRYLGSEEDEKKMKNMEGMDMNGSKKMDSSMKMNDSTTGMKNMKTMDPSVKMKGMDKMKDMKGMGKMKGMKGMDKKSDMNGMGNMKDTDNSKNMEDMSNMNGMKYMKGMNDKNGMMNMKSMNLIDTAKPYDNNPVREQAPPPKKID